MTVVEKAGKQGRLNRRDILLATACLFTGTALGTVGGMSLQRIDERKRVAIGILGQSNEQNRVLPSDSENYPGAFGSVHNRNVTAPQFGNAVMQPGGASATGGAKRMLAFGGMWFAAYDGLWARGYDVTFVNGAIGSASMVSDIAGSTVPWRPKNSGYCKRRLSIGQGDFGYAGSVIVAGTPEMIFRCVEGRDKYASLTSAGVKIPGTKVVDQLDYILSVGQQLSGDREPDWNSASKQGATIKDGDIVWQCEGPNNIGLAAASTGRGGFNQTMGAGYWDPLGILSRLTRLMEVIQGGVPRWIIIQNGQSEYGGSNESRKGYQQALENITQYFLDRGFSVMIGLSCFAMKQEIKSWEGLSAARDDALSTFNGNTRVRSGANLYKALGTKIEDLLQSDEVHLNGKGAIAAGQVWADQLATNFH